MPTKTKTKKASVAPEEDQREIDYMVNGRIVRARSYEAACAKPAQGHTPGLSERIIQLWFSGTPCPELTTLADAAPDLLAACKASEELLAGQMDEAESLEHSLDGHDADQCALCQLHAAIAQAEGRSV